jgi:hypothetical protein
MHGILNSTFNYTLKLHCYFLDYREFFAASKIAALIRGYLDRLLCNRLKKRLRAIRTIQRIILGKIGRLRWKREYWRSVSVVKSDSALQVQTLNDRIFWLL